VKLEGRGFEMNDFYQLGLTQPITEMSTRDRNKNISGE
jgi:hypothetical protein